MKGKLNSLFDVNEHILYLVILEYHTTVNQKFQK